jgi:hypothetical protein
MAAAHSVAVRTLLHKPTKRINAASAQKEPDRGELPRPGTEVSVRIGLIPASLRHDMISESAYFRAEARGFFPGRELEDWLAAEREIDDVVKARYGY